MALRSTRPLEVGDRVMTVKDRFHGTVRFIGDTQFSTGQWLGIELDEPRGKNDGSVNDVRYFECAALHGLFVKDIQVRLLTAAEGGGNVMKGSGSLSMSLSSAPTSPNDADSATASGGSTSGKSRLEELKEKRNAMLAARMRDKAPGDVSPLASPIDSPTLPSPRPPATTTSAPPPPPPAPAPAGPEAPSSRPALAARRTSLSTATPAQSRPPVSRTSLAPSSRSSLAPSSSSTSVAARRTSLSSASSATAASRGVRSTASPSSPPKPTQRTAPSASSSTPALRARTASVSSVTNPTSADAGAEDEDDGQSVRSMHSEGSLAVDDDTSAPPPQLAATSASALDPLPELPTNEDQAEVIEPPVPTRMSLSGMHSTRVSMDAGSTRMSLSGKEGEATATQVMGLKTLLSRKNAEMEALKQKVEEGQDALRSLQASRERADKLEKDLAEEQKRRAQLDVEVTELRKEAARSAERRHKSEQEAVATDAVRQRCEELEAVANEKQTRCNELEVELRGLKMKLQHGQEEEKAKWAELAKEKAAAAGAGHRVAELEGQVASLNDAIELLSLDKEQLIIDKELLEERIEELGMELETAKLELETAELGGAAQGGGGAPMDEDAKVINEQNVKLRAALKKLQEISQAEKSELLRRQRELERDLSHAEQSASQLQELKAWKASKEGELSELREMVEVGHAYESMVETLTTKNLELEQRLADLRVHMSELEVAQELSEELEAQQAEEAAALRKDVESMGVVMAEKDGALRQAEARVADRDKTLARFRSLVTQLTAERDELKEQAEQRAAALGEARGRAMDVMGQMHSLKTQAKGARSRQVGEALARIDAANAHFRATRYAALLPQQILDREAGALEGDLALARLHCKASMALEVLTQGYGPWLLPKDERVGEAAALLRQETPSERLLRVGGECRIAEGLGRALQATYFLILRLHHPAFDTSPDLALSLSAEASSLLLPLERLLDELLRLMVEEGGVPPHAIRMADLDDALSSAESLSLLRDNDHATGLSHSLWVQAGASAHVALLPLLTSAAVVQASTLLEDASTGTDAEAELGPLRAVAREAAKLPFRLRSVPSSFTELLSTAGYDEPDEAACFTSLSSLHKELLSLSSTLTAAADREGSSPANALEALARLRSEWARAAGKLKPASVRGWEGREAAFGFATQGGGGNSVPCLVRAMRVRKQLLEATELGPLLAATKEAEKRLTQELRDRDKQQDVLRARVSSLEELLHQSQDREHTVDDLRAQVDELNAARDKLEQENHVLSEALEVVQTQADALETETRRLKLQRQGSSTSSSSPSVGRALSAAEMPLVASTALGLLDTSLRHAYAEMAHWRALAAHSLLRDLKPLDAGAGAKRRAAVGGVIDEAPEATGREESFSKADEGSDRVRWSIQETLRLQRRVTELRCSPRLVSVPSVGERKKRPRAQMIEQQVAAGRVARECGMLRERVGKVLCDMGPGLMPNVKTAGPASSKLLLGRLKMAGERASAVPVLLDESQFQYITAVMASV